QEHPRYGLLLAPVSARGSQEKDPIYQLIARLETEKQDLEASRLLYVATTRAIRHLHLLGHAEESNNGDLKPRKGSLLEKLWTLLQDKFLAAERHSATSADELRPPMLHRLPPDWVPPVPKPAIPAVPSTSGVASSSADTSTIFSGWENPAHRHVGTLIHLQLEQIARFGINLWLTKDGDELQHRMKRSLSSFGVAESDLEENAQRVVSAINTTLTSQRGQWILDSHSEQSCELPLTGIVHGELIHAVIDRTFVADGCRWVIDYKTSIPGDGETKTEFLNREAEHYRKQLQTYVQLLTMQSNHFPIRAALYFPPFDGWYEYSLL
ncbi:MAG: PD-(D/E)XK nuclease family protein, partial [Thermodesulfobacteriota bacterium]|nr:PD-(D/E)XK nuclease family protein [Thermodesulfobacteriota bacterium]